MSLLWVVNSYYSNKIEGNAIEPGEIMRNEEPPHGMKSAGMQEVLSHIDVQRSLSETPIDNLDLCTKAAICRLHRGLYADVPEDSLVLRLGTGGETARMMAGEL